MPLKGVIAEYGNHGPLGVCTICVDLVPVVKGVDPKVRGEWTCGNRPHQGFPLHDQRYKWTETKRHFVNPLNTEGAGFCRQCRMAVAAPSGKCLRRPWQHPLTILTPEIPGSYQFGPSSRITQGELEQFEEYLRSQISEDS